nr:hypothetical protein CFP56_19523 [Quercus suber]
MSLLRVRAAGQPGSLAKASCELGPTHLLCDRQCRARSRATACGHHGRPEKGRRSSVGDLDFAPLRDSSEVRSENPPASTDTASSLKLSTIAPDAQSLEGTLITADPLTNLIAINTRAAGPAIDAHIIPVSKIQSFQLLSVAQNGAAGFGTATPLLGPVDLARLKKREDERVAKLQEQLRDRGAGVTREAQDIFDAFKRM